MGKKVFLSTKKRGGYNETVESNRNVQSANSPMPVGWDLFLGTSFFGGQLKRIARPKIKYVLSSFM